MKARSQKQHSVYNKSNFPGTRQLCVVCDNETERCEEDALYLDKNKNGPVCEGCYDKAKIVDVWVILFPDGLSHYFLASDGKKYLDKCIGIWKDKDENRQKYENNGFVICVANIRMFESNYNKMVATDMFIDKE